MRQSIHRLASLGALALLLSTAPVEATQKAKASRPADEGAMHAAIDAAAAAILPKVVAWRRDFHEHPEPHREPRGRCRPRDARPSAFPFSLSLPSAPSQS